MEKLLRIIEEIKKGYEWLNRLFKYIQIKMSDFNLKKNPLKIVIVGPQKVGKTVIENSLSEFSHTVSPDYHQNVSAYFRIRKTIYR